MRNPERPPQNRSWKISQGKFRKKKRGRDIALPEIHEEMKRSVSPVSTLLPYDVDGVIRRSRNMHCSCEMVGIGDRAGVDPGDNGRQTLSELEIQIEGIACDASGHLARICSSISIGVRAGSGDKVTVGRQIQGKRVRPHRLRGPVSGQIGGRRLTVSVAFPTNFE